MGNMSALALMKLRFGRVSMMRFASSDSSVVVEPGKRSTVLIGAEYLGSGSCCGIIGLSVS